MTAWQKDQATEVRTATNDLGGTMRLGSYPCNLVKETMAEKIYGKNSITERHRHRYEVNLNYKTNFEKVGVVFAGMSPDGNLTEIIELKNHKFFVAVQFHPELKSRPFSPHPIFCAFVRACYE
jgi:CTP synthase